MIGNILIAKGYLIDEELGTQITQKTFRNQNFFALSRQQKAVFGQKLQKVHLQQDARTRLIISLCSQQVWTAQRTQLLKNPYSAR
jgi:hypothetical protein